MKHQITDRQFGTTPSGEIVTEYTLINKQGLEMRVINYGCTITSLKTPDRNGMMDDIVLGFDTLEAYISSPHYVGCIIGRCAGRISHGLFQLDGVEYKLDTNQQPHHLHGGFNGFDKRVWEAITFENELGIGIDFRYLSADMEEGYPGNLSLIVRYFLSHDNNLLLHYAGKTDRKTIVNLTQHSYFNLNGGRETILKHGLQINANQYLLLQKDKVPTGEILPVKNTPLDFSSSALVLQAFLLNGDQVNIAKGLDHCWVLHKSEDELAFGARLFDAVSGRVLDLYTTQPGLQVYSGNYLEGEGKNEIVYGPYSGIALETQHFPDTPNQPDFPSIILQPDEEYSSKTIWRFSVQE